MQRISLAWLIESFVAIEQLKTLQGGEKGVGAWSPLWSAKQKVEDLFTRSVYQNHLRISPQKAEELLAVLSKLIDNVIDNDEYALTEIDAFRVRSAGEQFRIVFLSEVATLPSFMVSPKANYDLDRLIDDGLGLFPQEMVNKVPESLDDALEASRSLAFERNTACGFHTFRVVEAVLRRYWDAVSQNQERPTPQTLGKIAKKLEDDNLGKAKVYETLKQLAKLHRNPIAHPEVILSSDEAIAILGIAYSAITPMLEELREDPNGVSTNRPH